MKLLRSCVAVAALLLCVATAHVVAKEESGLSAQPLHGILVTSVVGVSDVATELLAIYAAEHLAGAEVVGSYTLDIAVRLTDEGGDPAGVFVEIFWKLSERNGPTLVVARQFEHLMSTDLEQFPEQIWPAAAAGVAPELLHLVKRWEQMKTRL